MSHNIVSTHNMKASALIRLIHTLMQQWLPSSAERDNGGHLEGQR